MKTYSLPGYDEWLTNEPEPRPEPLSLEDLADIAWDKHEDDLVRRGEL